MDSIADLVAAGRFSQALSALRSIRTITPDNRLSHETLLAELLQATGKDEEAIAVAEQVLRHRPLDPSLAARCHIALGEVDRNAGRAESAIENFRTALRNPALGTTFDRCHGRVSGCSWLLRPAPDLTPQRPICPRLRRDIARLGDPVITTVLHLFIAQVEAQRGLFNNAREHLRIARSLMGKTGSAYCEAVAAISASCVAFSVTDLETAATRGAPSSADIHRVRSRSEHQGSNHQLGSPGVVARTLHTLAAFLRTRKPDFSARWTGSRGNHGRPCTALSGIRGHG